MLAILIGMELQCRVSLAIARGKAHPGWYMTGLTGGIGVAAAVGRLLALDHESMTSALALAVSQGCGTRATHGSMAAALVPALGARNGLVSAFMAASGFTCSATALDGKNSLLQVLSAVGAEAMVLDRLGSHYEVLANTYKPYPTAIVFQPAIDACIRLKSRHDFITEGIASVEFRVHPRAIDLGGNMAPRDYIETQVSMIHWVAIALEYGRARVEHENPDASDTALLRALKRRISFVADEKLAPDQARATLQTTGGAEHVEEVEHVSGSLLNPMTDGQLREKFDALCARYMDDSSAARLWEQCWGLEQLPSAGIIPEAGGLK
jgi:2-methylcitrate dehydratase PrpD